MVELPDFLARQHLADSLVNPIHTIFLLVGIGPLMRVENLTLASNPYR